MPPQIIPFAQRPSEPQPVLAADAELERRQMQQARDRRQVCNALLIAALLHGVFLFFKLAPAEATAPPPRPEVKAHKLAPTPRFLPREPDPPPVDVTPTSRARPIPVPEVNFAEIVREPEIVAPPLPPRELGTGPWVFVPPPPEPPAPDAAGPIPVTGKVRPPIKLHAPSPRYPPAALRVRLPASVVLRAVIDREGRVVELEVVRGAPLGMTEATLDAVREWRFEPATLDEKPVAVYLYLTVDFRPR